MPEIVIHRLAEWNGNEVFVLREDLLPLACGGNKVRIVQKLLEDARGKGATAIVGYGNSRSNMCRVLAMMCAKEGVSCVIVSPSDDDGSHVETANSRIVRMSGARIVTCRKGAAVSETLSDVMKELADSGACPYYVFGDAYGHGNEAVLSSAYEDVAQAILNWQVSNGLKFDRVALAVGTGSTYAGLVKGFRSAGSSVPVTGFSIARDLERCKAGIVAFTNHPTDVLDIALGGGYGRTSAAELDFLAQVRAQTAILFDPVYAGKALWGLSMFVQETGICGERILFVHTGSLPLALDGLQMTNSFEICRLSDFAEFALEEYDRIVGQMPQHALHGEELRAYIRKMLECGVVYVIKNRSRLLGLIGFYCNDFNSRRAYLSMIACDESIRGTGAATALMNQMFSDCRRVGMRTIEATVVRDNLRATCFYKRLGFVLSNDPEDATRFHMRLEFV